MQLQQLSSSSALASSTSADVAHIRSSKQPATDREEEAQHLHNNEDQPREWEETIAEDATGHHDEKEAYSGPGY